MAVLIFDFDGTIHDSMCIYAPAVRACQQTYAAMGLLPDREVPDAQIRSYLGLTAAQMWQSFAPHLSKEQQEEGSRFIYREMEQLARNGTARLYEGAVSMLKELRQKGHRLIFLSNCSRNYMQLHQEVFGLDHIFHEMYCAEQFDWEPKPWIVRRLLPGWMSAAEAGKAPEQEMMIAIGDRYTDMEIRQAAKASDAAVRTIFCAYGFGSLQEGTDADAVVYSVEEIPAAVCKVSESTCFPALETLR